MISSLSFGGNLYNKIDISIFSNTKNTITLFTTTNSYFGGAHGNYNVEFQNFYNKKPIKLTDIIIDYKSLLKLAKKHYKFIHLLKQNQSLLDDGWFENNFILPNNFAITNRGLLFYYNNYEIKAYSFGDTIFILPYYKIKNILKIKPPIKKPIRRNNYRD